MQEPLVIALQLVVQDHAIDSAALLAEALLGGQVRAIDLRIVRQLPGLSEARVERLAWLPRAFVSLVPIRFEQVPAVVGEDDRAIIRAERRRAQETFSFEVALGATRVIPAVVEIALGHDTKGADGGKHPAFGAVDLVHPIAFPRRPSLPTARKVEVLGEHLPWVTLMIAIALTCTASTAEVELPRVDMIAMIVTSIVPVPHSPALDFPQPPYHSERAAWRVWTARQIDCNQPWALVRLRRVVLDLGSGPEAQFV